MDPNDYLHLVDIQASLIYRTIPKTPILEFEDLVGYGTLGLLDAIKKYNPTHQVKFETYAAFRIRGAISDGVRSAYNSRRKHQIEVMQLEDIPLNKPEQAITEDHISRIDAHRLKAKLFDTTTLDRQERLVLVLYFFEDLLYDTIAKILKVSPGRITQIRDSALSKLKLDFQTI